MCPHSLFIVSVLFQHATPTSSGGLSKEGALTQPMMSVERAAIGHLDFVRLVLDTAAGRGVVGKGRDGGRHDPTRSWDRSFKVVCIFMMEEIGYTYHLLLSRLVALNAFALQIMSYRLMYVPQDHVNCHS